MAREQIHITEREDIPRKPEAVFNKDGHIKPSFQQKFAQRVLEVEARGIELLASRRRLSEEERVRIDNLRQRAGLITPDVPGTGMSDGQFIHMRMHIMRCKECAGEVGKIKGDLPTDSLPF